MSCQTITFVTVTNIIINKIFSLGVRVEFKWFLIVPIFRIMNYYGTNEFEFADY